MPKTKALNEHLKEYQQLEEFKKWKRNKQQKQSKVKYDREHYSSLQVHLDRELVLQFKALVNKLGFKQSEILRFFVIEFMEHHEDYIEDVAEAQNKKDFDYDEYRKSEKNKRFECVFEAMTSEEDIIKYFHDPYQENSKKAMLPFAQHLGFDYTYKSKKADIVYSIQKYYADKLKTN